MTEAEGREDPAPGYVAQGFRAPAACSRGREFCCVTKVRARGRHRHSQHRGVYLSCGAFTALVGHRG